MRLSALLLAAGYPAPPGTDPEINDIVSDSRRVRPGCLFVALRGRHHDGHDHLAAAAKSGAVAAVVEAGCTCPAPAIPTVALPDTRAALACLWNAWYGHPAAGMRLVAVTGTNGKTSVSHMLAAICRAGMTRVGLIGTVGCFADGQRLPDETDDPLANLTTPDPASLYRMLAQMRDAGVEIAILEASSHALALGKLTPLRFSVGIYTNLTPEHLDFHGSMADYLAAKLILFRACETSVINRDDPHWAAVAAAASGRVLTCACASDADCTACEITSCGVDGVAYLYHSRDARFHLRSPIPGDFTASNSLLAAATALALGFSPIAVQDGLASLGGVPGRMERLPLSLPFAVFIDYAHTPDALARLLASARAFRGQGRVVVLFGCGGDRDPTKRAPMGRIATEMADFTIITSDNPRTEPPRDIIADILRGIDRERPYTVILDRGEAIDFAVRHARPGDILLLAGKGHERYSLDAAGRHPFDERACVADAAARWWGVH